MLLVVFSTLLVFICPAYADGYIFTAHGVVHEVNGTPIEGAAVKLVDMNGIFLGSAITDKNGSFDFVNINSTTDNCSVRITYPDDNSYITPTNYFVMFPAKDTQFVNVTRYKYHDYRPSPGSDLVSVLGLMLAGLMAILREKK